MKKNLTNKLELVIKKDNNSFTVFDNITKSQIDMFPNNEYGFDELMQFLDAYLYTQDEFSEE